jgi:hypothetical protein
MNPIVGRVAQSDSGLWLGTMLLLAAAAVTIRRFLVSLARRRSQLKGTQRKKLGRSAEVRPMRLERLLLLRGAGYIFWRLRGDRFPAEFLLDLSPFYEC